MQPAVADVVQNSILPLSTATAGAFRAARMSFPRCAPPARGCPKSSWELGAAATGEINVGTPLGCDGAAAAVPARPRVRAKRRTTPRAVVRWRLIKLRFALEGRHPTRLCGRLRGGVRVRAANTETLMRLRLTLAGALAA